MITHEKFIYKTDHTLRITVERFERSDKLSLKLKEIEKFTIEALEIDIHSKKQTRDLVNARTLFIHMAFKHKHSQAKIALFLNKNHATIYYAQKLHEDLITTNKDYIELYNEYRIQARIMFGNESRM